MLVGRDSEMTQLAEALQGGKHMLVVISGKPGMGKSSLLKELRSRAESLSWKILPEEESDGTIAINWKTTEKDFLDKASFKSLPGVEAGDLQIQTTSHYPSPAVPESAKDETGKKDATVVSVQNADIAFQPLDINQGAFQGKADALSPSGKLKPTSEFGHWYGGTLILIDNYQPDKNFEAWFLERYIPDMRRGTSPIVIVVAGIASDLGALKKTADRKVELGELQIQAATEYFRKLNDDIEVKMEEKEIQVYADKSAKDPNIIDALTRLLQLK
jgi:hypothetical protein